MKVSKQEGQVIDQAIRTWREKNVISEADSHKLWGSYEVIGFDWSRVAKYAFWLAIVCILIALSAALADEWLIALFEKLFNAPDFVKCIGFGIVSIVLFFLGVRRKNSHPYKVYSNETLFFLGIVSTTISIFFLGTAIDTWFKHTSLLLLLAAVIYGLLGLWLPSKLVWLFGLLSLGCWFGVETSYAVNWGAYYLGMNLYLRFVIFGLVLLFVGSYVFSHWQAKREFLAPTKLVGLLYLFIALWMMSIFGNYGDLSVWKTVKQIELIHWSVLFAFAALVAIYHGVKYDDAMTRGFGLAFIFINLYTRFFEYFWEGMHTAIFFGILALSFWYLGSRSERVWQLSLLKDLSKR